MFSEERTNQTVYVVLESDRDPIGSVPFSGEHKTAVLGVYTDYNEAKMVVQRGGFGMRYIVSSVLTTGKRRQILPEPFVPFSPNLFGPEAFGVHRRRDGMEPRLS